MRVRDKTVPKVSPSARDPIGGWLDVFVPMLGVSGARKTEIRAELEDHLRARVDDLMIAGQNEADAAQQAVEELGQTAELARAYRAALKPIRRPAVQTLMIGAVGALVTWGAVSLTLPNQVSLTRSASTPEEPASSAPSPATAPFNPQLRRYEVGAIRNYLARNKSTLEDLRSTIEQFASSEGNDTLECQVVGDVLYVETSSESHDRVAWFLATFDEKLQEERAKSEASAQRRQQKSDERAAFATIQHERRIQRLQDERDQLIDQRVALRDVLLDISAQQVKVSNALNHPFDHDLPGQAERDAMQAQSTDLARRKYRAELEALSLETRLARVCDLLIDAELSFLGLDSGGLEVFAGADAAAKAPTNAESAAIQLAKRHLDLRNQVSLLAMNQVRQITMHMIQFAQEHGAMPTRPSQMREYVQEQGHSYELFLTPSDRLQAISINMTLDEAWAWVDLNASFELFPGELFDPESVIVRSKQPMANGLHAHGFADAHVEQVQEPDPDA